MRERRRVAGYGITSYDYNDMSGDFVFSACNSLFLVTDSIMYAAGTLEVCRHVLGPILFPIIQF